MTRRALCLMTLLPSFAAVLSATQAARAQEPLARTSVPAVGIASSAWNQSNLPLLPAVPAEGTSPAQNAGGAGKTLVTFRARYAAFRLDTSAASLPCTFTAASSCDSDSSSSQEQVASAPLSLHIDILEGEGALNNIRQRTAREPIVQVEDQNHKPVAGALILFAVRPGANGAGASFANAPTLSEVTDANGRAAGRGFQPNQQTGSYTIEVTATVGAVIAAVTIDESNTTSLAKAKGQHGGSSGATPAYGRSLSITRVVLIECAVVGLGVTTALLLNENNSTSITVGTSTVGPAFRR